MLKNGIIGAEQMDVIHSGEIVIWSVAALAHNTSLVPNRSRQTNPRSSLGFDIHHSRLTRDDTPPSSRVGALARRIEGEPGRIGNASKGSALRYAAFGGYSG